MRNLGIKLLRAPREITEKLRASRPHLACYKVLSLISKRDVSILEAYQDSREERNLPVEKSKELHRPYLGNITGFDIKYTHGAEQSGGDNSLRDNVQPTFPPKNMH